MLTVYTGEYSLNEKNMTRSALTSPGHWAAVRDSLGKLFHSRFCVQSTAPRNIKLDLQSNALPLNQRAPEHHGIKINIHRQNELKNHFILE